MLLTSGSFPCWPLRPFSTAWARVPATTSPPKSGTASVTPDLDAILLSADQINTVMGASGMRTGPIGRAPLPPHVYVVKSGLQRHLDCRRRFGVRGQRLYRGVAEQRLQEPGDNRQHLVGQAAVRFPSADRANDFVKSSADKWRACTTQTMTQTDAGGTTVRWVVGNLSGADLRIMQGHSHTGPHATAGPVGTC